MVEILNSNGRQFRIGRAPRGGMEFSGRFYRGGQFVPVAAFAAKPLPALKGSVKQVKWAEELRSGMLAAVDGLLTLHTTGGSSDMDREKITRLKVVRHMVAKETSASFLIDQRRMPALYLYFDVLDYQPYFDRVAAEIGA